MRENASHRRRELQANLVLLCRRESVDYSIKRLRGIVGVKRRKDEVSRFCGSYRSGHSFRPAHLAYHQNINVLPKGRLQSRRKILRVHAHFSLLYQRLFRLVYVFNRVFNRENMLHALGIYELNQRREGRRLALPHRTNHQKESLRLTRKSRKHIRQIQFGKRANFSGDKAQSDAHRAALIERVSAKTNSILCLISKIDFLRCFKMFFVFGTHERLEKSERIFVSQNWLFQHWRKFAGNSDCRMRASRKMNV